MNIVKPDPSWKKHQSIPTKMAVAFIGLSLSLYLSSSFSPVSFYSVLTLKFRSMIKYYDNWSNATNDQLFFKKVNWKPPKCMSLAWSRTNIKRTYFWVEPVNPISPATSNVKKCWKTLKSMYLPFKYEV